MPELCRTQIAQLNDAFRTTLHGGKVLLTQGITALPEEEQNAILTSVKTFNAFTPDNDPYLEHDFGAFEQNGERIFWKIYYYNRSMTFGSEDPSNPDLTMRVLTIMLAEEY